MNGKLIWSMLFFIIVEFELLCYERISENIGSCDCRSRTNMESFMICALRFIIIIIIIIIIIWLRAGCDHDLHLVNTHHTQVITPNSICAEPPEDVRVTPETCRGIHS
jgi:hypothetical protein